MRILRRLRSSTINEYLERIRGMRDMKQTLVTESEVQWSAATRAKMHPGGCHLTFSCSS